MVRDRLQTDQILHGVSASPLVTSLKDPSTFFGFCVGTGLPRMGDDLSRPHGHYTFCPVWEAEKKRIWENRELMRAPRRPGLSPAAEAALSGIEQGDAIEEWMAEDRVRA
jgi:hypothetical protein